MKYTKDIIAIIIILAAVASLFVSVNQTGEELVRYFAVLIIGYYFGTEQIQKAVKKIFGGKNQQLPEQPV